LSEQILECAALEQAVREAERLRAEKGQLFHDQIAASIYSRAEDIAKDVVSAAGVKTDWDHKIDRLVTSRIFGYPLMLSLLGAVFWLTITGANYPSALLGDFFSAIEKQLTALFALLDAPAWLHGVVVLGTYRSLAWVISVMLPPMAIFFPLFTLLEELG